MRLIDADALLKDGIRAEYGINDNGLLLVSLRDVKRSIENAQTVDAKPVVHGRWIETPSMAPEYECSNCGRTYEWWEVSEAHYCPNCGAKMDGGNEDAKN